MSDVPPPVDRSVVVALAPDAAFALFTGGMHFWWPFAGHSCSGEAGSDVVFEPRPGGAVTEIARSGARFAWGTLEAWEPPQRFVMRWHPGLPADAATRLEVRFSAVAGGTAVRVVHDGWAARGAQARDKRDQYDGGWPATLAAFAAHAAHAAASS